MSLTKQFTDFALEIDTGTKSYIQGIQDQGLDPGLQELLEGGSGSNYNSFGAIAKGAPSADITSTDIKAVLDLTGATGMPIDEDHLVTMYNMRRLNGAAQADDDSGLHQSALFSQGIMIPRTLSADHQGTAKITLSILAIKAGEVDPIVYTHNANLPAGVKPGVSDLYTMGPIKLNTTLLDGSKTVSIDFGITAEPDSSDGDIYPSFVSIGKVQPTITATTQHIDLAGTLTMAGKYYVASHVICYLRKRAEGGTYVADITAQHIKITLGKCLVLPGKISGNPKQMSVKIVPWHTGGVTPVYPLAINTASAIS